MTQLSSDGFTEVLIAGGCASAIIASWIIGIVLIFFPRHETETYRRRLVANMPRARDETLPTELQLKSTIDSISMTTTIPGQSTVDATKDDEVQQQDEPFEEGSNKQSGKEDAKDQPKQEKKSKPPVPKLEQPEKPEKKKEKPAVEKKGEKPAAEKKREKPAAEKKTAKSVEKKEEKKDDKKGKEEKPKEKAKKKK